MNEELPAEIYYKIFEFAIQTIDDFLSLRTVCQLWANILSKRSFLLAKFTSNYSLLFTLRKIQTKKTQAHNVESIKSFNVLPRESEVLEHFWKAISRYPEIKQNEQIAFWNFWKETLNTEEKRTTLLATTCGKILKIYKKNENFIESNSSSFSNIISKKNQAFTELLRKESSRHDRYYYFENLFNVLDICLIDPSQFSYPLTRYFPIDSDGFNPNFLNVETSRMKCLAVNERYIVAVEKEYVWSPQSLSIYFTFAEKELSIISLKDHQASCGAIITQPNPNNPNDAITLFVIGTSNTHQLIWWIEKDCKISLLKRISGHKSKVTSLHYVPHLNILFSASGHNDKSIRGWWVPNFHNREEERDFLEGDLKIRENSNYQGIISSKIPEKYVKKGLIKILEGHKDRICCITHLGELLFSGGGKGEAVIRIWNMVTCECVSVVKTPHLSVRSMEFVDDFLVTGGSKFDRKLIFWKYAKKDVDDDSDDLFCLQANSRCSLM